MTTSSSPNRSANHDNRTDAAVLFDMDGIVLEGRGTDPIVHSLAFDDALAELDESPDIDGDTREVLSSYEYTTAFEMACETVGLDPVELYTIREEYSVVHTIDRIRDGKRALHDDAGAITELASQYTTGLVSNNYDPVVTVTVEQFDLEEFSFVRGRDPGLEGFRRRKPDPYYIQEALDALDIESGFYVGDRVTDLIAAERAGLHPVFVRRSHNRDVDPEVETYLEVQSLTELSTVLSEYIRA